MSDTQSTSSAPKSASPALEHQALLPPGVEQIADPTDWYEDSDYSMEQHLGLRPTRFRADDLDGSHPDQRECPSWCWVGQHEEYGHEIDVNNPWYARHTTEWSLRVAASLYRAQRHSRSGIVTSATFEPRLEQVGQGAPMIKVGFSTSDSDGNELHDSELFKLTINDAQDLIRALEYLVGIVDHEDAQRQRDFMHNAFELGRDHEAHRCKSKVHADRPA